MLKIGITGGIGSGKSTVCKVFGSINIPIYDADTEAKKIMITNSTLIKEIKENFGEKSYTEDGQLDRRHLAKIVFNDKEKLNLLNSLVHPKMKNHFSDWCKKHSNSPYVIKEAALMFESGAYKTLDKVITVYAPKDVRLERVIGRDKFRTKEEIEGIFEKQMSEEEKIEKADFCITNDGKEMIIPQVLKLHQLFTKNNK